MGLEAEPAQEQEQEQDFQWRAEFEATGSTTGDRVSNIRISKATIDDFAGRTRERDYERRKIVLMLRRIVQFARRETLQPLPNHRHHLLRPRLALQ